MHRKEGCMIAELSRAISDDPKREKLPEHKKGRRASGVGFQRQPGKKRAG